jgi:serine/threonine protein kinase
MQLMQGVGGFPQIFFGVFSQRPHFYVMRLLGPSLGKYARSRPGGKLDARQLASAALRMLDRIHAVHSKGLVIYDVLPDNFLIHKGEVYLIDLGMALPYMQTNGIHVAQQISPLRAHCKTSQFSSYNDLQGYSVSRRDDLERLVYVLLYLATGTLPWMYAGKAQGHQIKVATYHEHWRWFTAHEIKWLEPILAEVKTYTFESEPNYSKIRNMIDTYRKGLAT